LYDENCLLAKKIFFTAAIDHTPQIFYGRFQALALPDRRCLDSMLEHPSNFLRAFSGTGAS
jgi:hypothetical protein